MKLAKRDIVPQIKASALHVCLLSRFRERIEERAALWERVRREGADMARSDIHHSWLRYLPCLSGAAQ